MTQSRDDHDFINERIRREAAKGRFTANGAERPSVDAELREQQVAGINDHIRAVAGRGETQENHER